MAEGVNVRFAGELQRFLQTRVGDAGLYNSASEYIRDLVRRDYEQTEKVRWDNLEHELQPGMQADENEFVSLNALEIIKEAKLRKKKRNGR